MGGSRSERGNCHDRPKLSKANSARTGGHRAHKHPAGSAEHVVAGGAARRSFRCGTAAGRQVDLAPLLDAGGAWPWARAGSRGCSRARTCWRRPAPCAPWASSSSAPDRAAGGSGASASAAWPSPTSVLDLGNAGTGARLLMGLLAGHGFTSFLTGDASLRSRPMRRVIEPLSRMGVGFLARSGGRLPLALTGRTDLLPIVYESPVASAQVKSAVLLAGLHAPGAHHRGRAAGLARPYRADAGGDGRRGRGRDDRRRRPPGDDHRPARADGRRSFVVPGDPSSAGFPTVAAAVAAGSAVRLRGRRPQPAAHRPLYHACARWAPAIAIENERRGRRRARRRPRRSGARR